MRKIALLLLAFLVNTSIEAQKMITRSGEIKFEASMPALEEVAATSKTASGVFDTSNGEFAALILIKSFKFKVALMEEHFNENYMESSKFPKATFKGKVLNFDSKKITATKTAYDIEGDLTIHGVTKKVKTKINLALVGGKILATSNFNIKLSDYKIDVPSLVKDKIAKDAKIALNFSLDAK
jgi:polyisoprenoid-binding protein YceI